MRVVTAAEMREIDRRAIEERGIAASELMERAGRAVAEAVHGEIEPGAVLVLCGRGNNGGDGFVAARFLAESGYRIFVVPVFGTDGLSADAQVAFDRLPKERIELLGLPSRDDFALLFESVDGVIDAMLGTGSKPPLKEPLDWIVRAVNESRLPVIAVDIPTGLDADSGEGDEAIRALRTVAIGLPKLGMLTMEGVAACGAVAIEPIQFPKDLLESPKLRRNTLLASEASLLLPERPLRSHKKTFGLVTVCAGSAGMPGASIISGLAAMRSGVGLVRMHVPGAIRSLVSGHIPEAIYSLIEGLNPDHLSALSEKDWEQIAWKSDAMVIGPGMTMKPGAKAFLEQVLREFAGPTVLDADAISLIAEDSELHKLVRPNCVLTPHPGEMSRLLGKPVKEIEGKRWETAAEAAEKYQCVIVYKGFGTLVADPSGQVRHVPHQNSALARGATGDMLAGTVGGLLAQGVGPADAAQLGTFIGVLAADILTRTHSTRGVLVREILETFPFAWRELENLGREAAPG